MTKILGLVVAAVFAVAAQSAIAGTSSGTSSHMTPHSTSVAGVKRDSHGHMERSSSARSSFQHSHPCPSTGKSSGSCPGYVVDRVVPLKRGGRDDPSNMPWQTVQTAKAKDTYE